MLSMSKPSTKKVLKNPNISEYNDTRTNLTNADDILQNLLEKFELFYNNSLEPSINIAVAQQKLP